MKSSDILAGAVSVALLVVALLLCGRAYGSENTVESATAELLSELPRWHEDESEPDEKRSERLRTIARAMAEVTEGDLDQIARLVTVSWWESRLARHVHAGKCKPWECDRGRARGVAQVQLASGVPRELWDAAEGLDYESTLASMKAAQFVLTRAVERCGKDDVRIFGAYARGSCTAYFSQAIRRADWKKKKLVRLRELMGADR